MQFPSEDVHARIRDLSAIADRIGGLETPLSRGGVEVGPPAPPAVEAEVTTAVHTTWMTKIGFLADTFTTANSPTAIRLTKLSHVVLDQPLRTTPLR